MKVIIIGGGAAGFFAAINIAQKNPDYQVVLLEKTSKLLTKVKISGGGRCNVTNARSNPSELVPFYPRGSKKLHTVFKQFTTSDMVDWLKERNVYTKAEEDQRMFPVSDSSQTIIDCFVSEAKRHGVKIMQNHAVNSLNFENAKWTVNTDSKNFTADKVIVATGSSPAFWKILEQTGLEITSIVPSLFTFNIKDERIRDLQGISFDKAQVKVAGSKLEDTGPMLITHWGLSGPAILKLSAWGAYILEEKNYQFEVLVNFIGSYKQEETKNHLQLYKTANPKRKVTKYPLFDLPRRFWERITTYCGIADDTSYSELSKKQLNKLTEELVQGRYSVKGKSTFKDEFVTAGGVKLTEIQLDSFEAKRFPGLFLSGEVLDIDALTGGFNFQVCWSASWIISENI